MKLCIFICLFIFLGSLQLSLEDPLAIPEKEFIGIFDKITFDEHPELDVASKIPETSTDPLTVTKDAKSVNLPVLAFGVSIDDFTRLIDFQAITTILSSTPFKEKQEKAISECISQLNQDLKMKFSKGFESIPEKGPIEIKFAEFQKKYQLTNFDAFVDKCYIKSSIKDPNKLAEEVKIEFISQTHSFNDFRKLIIKELVNFQGNYEISLQSIAKAFNDEIKHYPTTLRISLFAPNSFNFEPNDFINEAYFRAINIKSNQIQAMESIDEFLNIYLICIDTTLEKFKNNDNNCASDFVNVLTDNSYLTAFYNIVKDGISQPKPSLIRQQSISIDEFNSKLSAKLSGQLTIHIAFADLPETNQHAILGVRLKSGNVSIPLFTTLDDFKKYVENETPKIKQTSQVLSASSPTEFFKKYFAELLLDKRIKDFLNIAEEPDKVKNLIVPPKNDDEDKNLVLLTQSYQAPVKSKIDNGLIVLIIFFLIILIIVPGIVTVYKIRQPKQNLFTAPIAA